MMTAAAAAAALLLMMMMNFVGLQARRRAARRKLKQMKSSSNYGDDLDLDDDNEDELGACYLARLLRITKLIQVETKGELNVFFVALNLCFKTTRDVSVYLSLVTYCACPHRDGQAELTWLACYIQVTVIC